MAEHQSSTGELNPTLFAKNSRDEDAIHIRKRTVKIAAAAIAIVILVALGLGLGLGLGLPAKAKADAENAAAASAAAEAARLVPFRPSTWGPAATSYRAAESAYVTSTVAIEQYSIANLTLYSGIPTTHSQQVITMLAAEESPIPTKGPEPTTGKVQVVPQFFSTGFANPKPIFVTTATYTAVGGFPYFTTADEQPGYAAVDCPASNGTQHIDPSTGALYTKYCYRHLAEAAFGQLVKQRMYAGSLNQCLSECTEDTFEDAGWETYAPCNAVNYDANITRTGPTSNCELLWLRKEEDGPDPGSDSSDLTLRDGDWAVAAAVRNGFVRGQLPSTFASGYGLRVGDATEVARPTG